MRLLGAVLAGGRSRRFGSDKALAIIDGKPLIAHAISALAGQTEQVLCCGRAWPGLAWLPDRPTGGGGPLAGLNAALHHARDRGFEAVLCAPIDVHPLSEALPLLADARCAVMKTQWTIGIWPTSLSSMLEQHLSSGASSFKSWLDAVDPLRVDDSHLSLRNINFRHDLAQSG